MANTDCGTKIIENLAGESTGLNNASFFVIVELDGGEMNLRPSGFVQNKDATLSQSEVLTLVRKVLSNDMASQNN